MNEPRFIRYTFQPSGTVAPDDPEVRDLLTALAPAGWEDDDDGRTVRLWLSSEAEAEPESRRRLDQLRALGTLSCAAQEPGWRDGWRRFHRPVVEGGVRVRPPWYPPDPGLLDVVIDTGMAFGTGSHFTTRLCLRALQELPRGSLVDVGTGSGVLALAALRLGFAPVWAMDNDPLSIDSCVRNANANGLEPRIFLGDVTDPAVRMPDADVVVANLLLGPIVELARRLQADDGAWAPPRLVLSGLLVEQGDEALAALAGYRLVRREASSGWVLLDLARRV